jgi:hypothetical protein
MDATHESRDERTTPPMNAGRSAFASTRHLRGLVVLIAMMLSLLGSPLVLGSDTGTSREHQIKAAFVYNFTKFIEWPAQSFPDANAPIIIGVLGETPFATELEQLVRDRKVNGHTILVKRIQSVAEAASTHLLFVSATEDAQLASLRAALESRPIVTVGESSSFAQSGGTITFILQDDKVRFEISTATAEQTGLRISAQLQKLAATVRRAAQ